MTGSIFALPTTDATVVFRWSRNYIFPDYRIALLGTDGSSKVSAHGAE